MMFDRILFPVDFSDPCRRAAPFVRAIAKRFRSEVIMLYVLQLPPPWYPPDAIPDFQALADVDEMRAQRHSDLQAFVSEELSDITTRREMVEGDPAAQIVKRAEAENVKLIMLATHGYSRLRTLLLGSVTAKVLDDARVPVWTAVHNNELQPDPPDRWRRIVCAVNLDSEAVRVIRWTADLARTETADVCVVHAVEAVDPDSTLLDAPTRDWVRETAHRKLLMFLEDSVRGLERHVAVEFGKAASVVRKAAMEWEADLVVIGRGDVGGLLGRLRSQTTDIIRESPCPVISV